MIDEHSSKRQDLTRFVERDGSALLVWFGGLGEPLTSDARFDRIGVSSLNLTDANSNWYVDGAPGIGGPSDLLAYIARIANDRHIICAGQSSGGYAAIRYGHALNAALIVAMAPQTGVRAPGMPWVPILSLDDLYRQEPRDHPISIHLSRSERDSSENGVWNDHLHAQALAAVANVTIHQHPYDSHAVSLYLNHHGSFLDAVQHDMIWHRLIR